MKRAVRVAVVEGEVLLEARGGGVVVGARTVTGTFTDETPRAIALLRLAVDAPRTTEAGRRVMTSPGGRRGLKVVSRIA